MAKQTKGKHTDGPWNLAEHHPHSNRDHQGCGVKVFSKALGFGEFIGLAYVQGKFDDAEVLANAQVIAAAPELLAIMRDVAAMLPVAARLHPDDLFKLQQRVTVVIAKAQGEAI